MRLVLLVLLVIVNASASVVSHGPDEFSLLVEFRYIGSAESVSVAGEFSRWAHAPIPLAIGEKGTFSTTLRLDHGLHEYKFIVDGEWIPDPDNPARTRNDFGLANSVFFLQANGTLELTTEVPEQIELLPAQDGDTPVDLVLLWQQHMPWLSDPVEDQLLGPWLRVHAAKDYLDMALRLRDTELSACISLSGVLLYQLHTYYLERFVPCLDHAYRRVTQEYEESARGHTDPWLDLLLLPVLDPDDEQQSGLLWRNAWSCLSFSDELAARWPRLLQLRDTIRAGNLPDADTAAELLTLFHLVWMDPMFLRGPVPLPSGDTLRVCDLVEEHAGVWSAPAWDAVARERLAFEYGLILENVIPAHRQLLESASTAGESRVEIATTPFAHPILPLLIDAGCAADRMPGATLPTFAHPEWARVHVELGRNQFATLFGRDPNGFWPGEGAVSRDALSMLGVAGLRWAATGGEVPDVDHPAHRAGAFRFVSQDDSILVLLRHTELSRSIGWRYRRYPGPAAAHDLVNRILVEHMRHPQAAITLVLDGENAWEFFELDHDADAFLQELYHSLEQMQRAGRIRTMTPSQFVARGMKLPCITMQDEEALPAGSWIHGDLSTWIGEPEENEAWRLLEMATTMTGNDLRHFAVTHGLDLAALAFHPDAEVRERVIHLLAAQGSDWCWWYGADRRALEGDEFWDQLYLRLLRSLLPAEEIPESLLLQQNGTATGSTLD